MQTRLLICLLLVLLTVGAFWQVWGMEFAGLDDDAYVTNNPNLQGGFAPHSIAWAFTTGRGALWQPMVWLSYLLDYQIGGLSARTYHVTNLVLHVANVTLLFLLLSRMTGAVWQSAFVAALLAAHPLHVESVAWIAERKGLLGSFFWILAVLIYANYAARPKRLSYGLVALCAALGLMSKATVVTLPLVLLLLDYWPLGRVQAKTKKQRANWPLLVREKVPLLALSAATAAVTVVLNQKQGVVGSFQSLPLDIRMANAVVAYGAYLGKMIWPRNLAVIYPLTPDSLPAWKIVVSASLLVCTSAVVIRLRRRSRYLVVGWLWYLITLLPTIGLVQVGVQVTMADRFSYIPLIGIFITLAWGVPELLRLPQGSRAFRYLAVPGVAVVLLLAVQTRQQVGYWRNGETLLRHALACTKGNYAAHNSLGVALAMKGNLEEAVTHFQESVRIKPDYPSPYNNLGLAMEKMGRFQEAADLYREAIRLMPRHADSHFNLGNALASQGKAEEAIAEYEEATTLQPDYEAAHYNLGVVAMMSGMLDEAAKHLAIAARINPRAADTLNKLATVHVGQGRLDQAIAEYRRAILIQPDYVDARKSLAIALFFKSDYVGAWREVRLCEKYGGKFNPAFLRDLAAKMPEPPE